MTDSPSPTIGTRDAARILGVSQRTALRMADAGQLGKVGRVQVGNGKGMATVSRRRVEALAAKRAAD